MMIQDIAPYTFHIEYKNEQPGEKDWVLCYRKNEVLLEVTESGECSFPTVGELIKKGLMSERDACHYLFAIDDMKFFLLDTEIPEFGNYHYRATRDLRQMRPMWKAFAAANGFRLWIWYGSQRFCGKCGKPMVHSQIERAMCCTECGNVSYPIICPSVIVAIRNGNKLLLTRYQASHSAYRNYALVAGYMETGETAEDTVRREVMEEVGLKVKNITYYKSQPWPFSGAFLMGFFCDVDGDDTISREEEELAEAVWMEREDLPDRSYDVSLTSEMMEQFRLNRDRQEMEKRL